MALRNALERDWAPSIQLSCSSGKVRAVGVLTPMASGCACTPCMMLVEGHSLVEHCEQSR